MKKLIFIKRTIDRTLPIFFFLGVLVSCSESKYNELVETEMSKNIIHDSIFFDFSFGQTKQEFFDLCWKLNNKKIVSHAPKSNFVEYRLPKTADEREISMFFYGIFNKEKVMTGMDLEFSYVSWSLWNKNLQSDMLALAVKDTLLKWYPGNGFIKISSKKLDGDIHVKVDGNRRILIEPIKDQKTVHARIDDLRFKTE